MALGWPGARLVAQLLGGRHLPGGAGCDPAPRPRGGQGRAAARSARALSGGPGSGSGPSPRAELEVRGPRRLPTTRSRPALSSGPAGQGTWPGASREPAPSRGAVRPD
ncbi:PREDICTED: translation initiation factor IF-2-like [Chinchilla lanigera]|uniref:translation initiation factor IF-2-like n=1 Tax=Chinchilla lanigera TaxID=34839 RepID=UPI00069808B9|nr:PREDICTED: translation initiation factor IF-2-like [Chinchilla lanigera]